VALGGKREGAGRKRGAAARIDAEARAKAMEGLTPLDYLLGIMRDEEAEDARRQDAAKAAAPYVHARLANVDANITGNLGVTVEIIRFGDSK